MFQDLLTWWRNWTSRMGRFIHNLLTNFSYLQLQTRFMRENVLMLFLQRFKIEFCQFKRVKTENNSHLKCGRVTSQWKVAALIEQFHYKCTTLFQYFSMSFFVTIVRFWRAWRPFRIVRTDFALINCTETRKRKLIHSIGSLLP